MYLNYTGYSRLTFCVTGTFESRQIPIFWMPEIAYQLPKEESKLIFHLMQIEKLTVECRTGIKTTSFLSNFFYSWFFYFLQII